ncbi:MAG: tRNA preQ1(34) S-adenosylmethionine ribosyltransferase-isomerase QueA [Alphaproteobacteria bacterium]|nr:tRNA preQ1(34) S-adenosylmethionine ribosyltransferase-isomerase QueA [Alphaproteobacteria bacterium]
MLVDQFDFDLPVERIAARPLSRREAARMLVVAPHSFQDARVGDLPTLLRPGDLAVFNDTLVIPARLFGKRGDARIEVTLHRRIDELNWRAFARPAKRLAVGQTISFADGFGAQVTDKADGGEIGLSFETGGMALKDCLAAHGAVPLPPYITKLRPADGRDATDYQTIMAKHPGAVAAPTAGLHFTEALLARLDAADIDHVTVTLHVGAGTFLPVKATDTDDHRMHSEWGRVSEAAAARIAATQAAGGRIVAVGTTSLRLLEAAAQATGRVAAFCGETDIFITPGFRFRVIDLLLTNFHLPRSTLFMLVSAFAGLGRMRSAYAHAIAGDYRFYSYGDCCLLRREVPR